jgi:Zn-dependent M16 (insulinase) family peptidase
MKNTKTFLHSPGRLLLLLCALALALSGSKPQSGYSKLIHGFRIAERDGDVITYYHEASGARLKHVDRPDDELAFAIAFKTVPFDNTGVNHILEHCLFEGSTEPGSKPFTYLVNHTSATFLNAMTFSNFTMYVFATRDEGESLKLAKTYLDCVFRPLCLEDEMIFRREGWRRELNGDGALALNGTVLNEMKGAYSSDLAYLRKESASSLFPQTPAQFDSGGYPEDIPKLEYDELLRVYTENCHPSKALFIAYGKQDIKGLLKLLDEEYLSSIDNHKAYEKPALMEKEPAFPNPVTHVEAYPATSGKTDISLNFVSCDRVDALETAKMELFASILQDGMGSPLKKATVEAGLAEEAWVEFSESGPQCYMSIILRGVDPQKLEEAKNAAFSSLESVSKKGVPQSSATSIANRCLYEIARRANDSRKGVSAAIDLVAEHVYGSAMTDDVYIKAAKEFGQKQVKEAASKLLATNHRSVVYLVPELPLEDEQPAFDAEQVKAETEAFSDWLAEKANSVDDANLTYEIVAKSKPPTFPEHESSDFGGMKLIHTKLDTKGISSLTLYLDASTVPQPLIGYAQILANVLGDFDSLPEASKASLGESAGCLAADHPFGNACEYTPRLHLNLKALDKNAGELAKAAAILLDPDAAPEKSAVKNYLVAAKSGMDLDYENVMPITDVQAQTSESGRYRYEMGGPAYHGFISGLLEDFESSWPRIEDNLISAKKAILDRGGVAASFTGSDEGLKKLKQNAVPLAKLLKSRAEVPQRPSIEYRFGELGKNTSHSWPLAQTQSAVLGGNLQRAGEEFNGAFLVTSSIVTYSLLWPKVRDNGGAYGVSVSANPDGTVFVKSYRDPSPVQTFEAAESIPEFLEKNTPSLAEFAGVRNHVLSCWDEAWRPNRLWDYGAKVELKLVDPAAILQIRKEIQAAVPEDCKSDSGIWKKLLEQGIRASGGRLGTLQESPAKPEIPDLSRERDRTGDAGSVSFVMARSAPFALGYGCG